MRENMIRSAKVVDGIGMAKSIGHDEGVKGAEGGRRKKGV